MSSTKQRMRSAARKAYFKAHFDILDRKRERNAKKYCKRNRKVLLEMQNMNELKRLTFKINNKPKKKEKK